MRREAETALAWLLVAVNDPNQNSALIKRQSPQSARSRSMGQLINFAQTDIQLPSTK